MTGVQTCALPILNEAMQWLQSQYVQFINRRHQRVGPLFQSRYKSNVVESDQYAMWLVRYIHRNPIPTLSGELGDYKWSSYQDYIGIKNFPSVSEKEFLLQTMGGQEGLKEVIREWIEHKKNIAKYAGLFLE